MDEKRKIKVAFLSFFNGLIERGVETLVLELGKRLSEYDIDLTLYQGGKTTKDLGFKTISIPVDWNPAILEEPWNLKRRLFLDHTSSAVRKFTLRCLRDLSREHYDIIVPWNNGWETIISKVATSAKIITVGQAGPGWDDRINLFNFPSAFVGFTDLQVAWARRINPFVAIEKIPNGVDCERFKPGQKSLKLDMPHPIVLSCGALVPLKRHELAIKAVSQMSKGSLIIVGKGERKDYLSKLGHEYLPDRFKIISLKHADMPAIYKSADVFTFPTSPWESFGLVLLEAMASNLPVVATNDPIRAEIIGEGGITCDVTNPQEYAEALTYCATKKWGNIPRQQALKYSWDSVTEDYANLFIKIAGR